METPPSKKQQPVKLFFCSLENDIGRFVDSSLVEPISDEEVVTVLQQKP